MTELSRERREELQREVNADELYLERSGIDNDDLRALLRDSAWRERVERQVRELADYLQVTLDEGKIQRDDPWKPDSVIKQLRAVVDTGDEEGEG